MNVNIPYQIIHVIYRNSEIKNLFDGQLEDSFLNTIFILRRHIASSTKT